MRANEVKAVLSDGSEVYGVEGAYWRYLVVPARARLVVRPGGRPALSCVSYVGEGVAGGWLVFEAVLAVAPAVEAELVRWLEPVVATLHAAAPGAARERPSGRSWKVVDAARGADPTAPEPGGPPPAPVVDGNAWWRGVAEVSMDGVDGSPWRFPVSGGEARVSVGVDLPAEVAARWVAALRGEGAAPNGRVVFEVAIEPTRAAFVGAPRSVRVESTLAELIAGVPASLRVGCLREVSLEEPSARGMRVELVAETGWASDGVSALEVALEVDGEPDELVLLTPERPRHVRFRRLPVSALRWRAHHLSDSGARAPWTPWVPLEGQLVRVRPPAVRELEVTLDAAALDFAGLVLQAMVTVWLEDEGGRQVHELGSATLRAGAKMPSWTGVDTGAAASVVFRVDYVLEGGQVISGPPPGVSWRVPIGAAGVVVPVPEPPVRQVRVPVLVESAQPLVQALVTWQWGDRSGTWYVSGMVRLTSERLAGEFSYAAPLEQLDRPYQFQVLAVRADGSAHEARGEQVGLLRVRVPRR